MNNTLRRALATSTALALAIAAGPALALGLGQIQVKSRPGQPLLAEIPIISGDPAELQGLQVQLASPETFRRIGLEPPQGDVSALRFEPAIDAQGRPVIRITSPTPVQQPLLTFLVEVDWSGGRLVREYSALVDTPRTVAAPAQPPIEAPTVAAPNTVAAPVQPAVPATQPAGTPPAANTNAQAPAAPRPVVAQQAPGIAGQPPGGMRPGAYQVRSGDTLAEIAAGAELPGASLDQAMLALLRTNPEAFIGGNINRLKAGAVLRTPSADELSRIGAGEAAALVHEQIAGWRQARKPVSQPAGAPDAPQATAARTAPAPASTPSADARLEIVPPSERGKQAGTRSGLAAGGEGDMLRQQLQETKETLAAREVEVQELKARVAELEKIRQDQQQLIQLKSSALAAAQQNLAKTNTVAPTAAAPVHAQGQQAGTPSQPGAAGTWMWAGLVLLVVALAGWLLTRRRSISPAPAPKRRFDEAALAAAVPKAEPIPAAPAAQPTASPAAVAITGAGHVATAAEAQPLRATSAHRPAPTVAPSWHDASASASPSTAVAEPADGAEPTGPRSAGEQLDLAQAYLDVGDEDAARTLLREVLDSRDPVAREAAARLLREL